MSGVKTVEPGQWPPKTRIRAERDASVASSVVHIPGNILNGDRPARLYVDDQATSPQKDALSSVWGGKKGGAVAYLAKLIGKVEPVE